MRRKNKSVLRWLKSSFLSGVLLFGAITIHPGLASATADSPMVSGPLA